MFACVDLTPAQIDVLKTQYHIYITNAGRLSISGCRLNKTTCLQTKQKDGANLNCSEPSKCRLCRQGVGYGDKGRIGK